MLAVLAVAGCASDTSGHGRPGGPAGNTDRFADQTQIVALALGGENAAGAPSPGRVYVDTRYCRILDAADRGPCTVRSIPAQVRHDVLRVVGPAFRFVGHAPEPSRTQVVVALGAPVIRGDSATIALDSMCGPLCGAGTTVHLRRETGRWREVGQRETDWIS